jgi:hypothetical protein
MEILGRDAILGASDINYETVEVPEWGGRVRVKSLTGKERDTFEAGIVSADGKRAELVNVRAKLVALTVVDEEGRRLFSEGDVEALGSKSAAALDRVFTAAQKLSALGQAALVAAQEAIEANPPEGSSSA